MSVFKPEVILISSDDEDDGDGRNLDKGLESEHDGGYIDLDKEEENDVEKSNEGECLDNCDGHINQGGSDLQELSLCECKTYLRKHGIRVTGSKEECILRMKEHGRLKDGSGESLYPISSFPINCTGDACRGDVVLFKQNLYNSQGKIIGRRTVAGRILKESYGASTQQHTFSVEVLWSKRSEKLDPLSILLVKGRNLYRFGTFRQPWESEEERLKVLGEKHERGKAARLKRKLRETEFASGDNKCTKRQKVYHTGPYQSERITRIDKENDVNKYTTSHSQAEWFQNMELERSMQLTNHPDPNRFIHNNNGHQGPNQAFSQPPDYHHHNHEPPVHRSPDEIARSRFPKSSFSINCTGDARNGDAVLFEQVYLGGITRGKKRIVAGRIVKVRQCKLKDEHKFLIKVLWITPSVYNPRRSTLLVRSRNLYKFGTFRQPWKNEANRSKMFEEKHGPATCKRKLKKTDIASNKTKGAKRQKVSYNGTSQGKKQIQKTKQKSPKKKDASATPVKKKDASATPPVKEYKKQIQKAKQKSSRNKVANATPVKETRTGHEKKAVQLQKAKVKKSKQKTFHPDPIPNPNPNTNLNPSLSINPNLISATSLNQNTHQNPNMKTLQKTNPNLNTWSNPNTWSNLNLNKRSNPKPNKQSNPSPNKRSNPKPKKRSNPNANKPSNPNTSTHPNPHPNPDANPNANKPSNLNLNRQSNPRVNKPLNPNANKQSPSATKPSNRNMNKQSNPSANKPSKPNASTHSNPHPHPNLKSHPNPNCYICPYHQPQEPPYNRTFMPNPPPAWYSHNQPPFGLPGYGGQWGPNHSFIQPPGLGYYYYNQLILQSRFWYWQQVQPW